MSCPARRSSPRSRATSLDELIVADDESRRRSCSRSSRPPTGEGVKVLIAPRTTELLVERGEYVPGQAVPLFQVRPPILAGADWAVKRAFDVVVAALVIVIGLPVWLLIALAIKLTSRGPVFYSDERVGLGERTFRMLKFRTMVPDAAAARRRSSRRTRRAARSSRSATTRA